MNNRDKAVFLCDEIEAELGIISPPPYVAFEIDEEVFEILKRTINTIREIKKQIPPKSSETLKTLSSLCDGVETDLKELVQLLSKKDPLNISSHLPQIIKNIQELKKIIASM